MRFRAGLGIIAFAAATNCALQNPAVLPAKAVTVVAPTGPSAPLPPAVGGESVKPPVRPLPSKINPDPVNPTGMLIEVSIKKQRLTAWNNGAVVMSRAISTGMPGYDTPTGHFHVIYKDAEALSKKWVVVMPRALSFRGNYLLHPLT